MALARLRRGLHGSAALAPAGGGGGGGNPSFTATANPAWFNSGYSDTNHTFTGVAIGTAAAGRYVIVGTALHSSANKNVTAITVGGVSLTKAVESAGTAGQKSSIWYGNVPTGTTADIAVSVTASFAIGELAIVVGEATLPTPTPTATAVRDDSYTGSAGSVNLTVPSNGIGIVVGYSSTTGDIGTWTNATQDYETVSGANAIGLAHTTSTGALTISMAGSGDNNINMAAAAWGP